jgi:hypothetical protein
MGDHTVLTPPSYCIITPTGRGINLTKWYIYQRYMIIHHTDPDDGGQADLWNVGF